MEKGKLDGINQIANNYIVKNNLKPGDPLPPKTFENPKNSIGRLLTKEKSSQIITEFKASNAGYETKVVSLITVGDTVPEEGEQYAYGALEHTYEIFGSNYSFYPDDDFCIPNIKKGLKELILKKKLQSETPQN
jgi:hypothetical protein